MPHFFRKNLGFEPPCLLNLAVPRRPGNADGKRLLHATKKPTPPPNDPHPKQQLPPHTTTDSSPPKDNHITPNTRITHTPPHKTTTKKPPPPGIFLSLPIRSLILEISGDSLSLLIPIQRLSSGLVPISFFRPNVNRFGVSPLRNRGPRQPFFFPPPPCFLLF